MSYVTRDPNDELVIGSVSHNNDRAHEAVRNFAHRAEDIRTKFRQVVNRDDFPVGHPWRQPGRYEGEYVDQHLSWRLHRGACASDGPNFLSFELILRAGEAYHKANVRACLHVSLPQFGPRFAAVNANLTLEDQRERVTHDIDTILGVDMGFALAEALLARGTETLGVVQANGAIYPFESKLDVAAYRETVLALSGMRVRVTPAEILQDGGRDAVALARKYLEMYQHILAALGYGN